MEVFRQNGEILGEEKKCERMLQEGRDSDFKESL